MRIRIVNQSPVRVGVVGCGVVADYGHIPAIHRSPDAQLVAFADPDPARRAAQAKKYNCPCFASLDEMAGTVQLDALTVATQPDIKLDLLRIAAAHGLHAFCEKPLTNTAAQAQALIQLMNDARLFVGTAFVYRGEQVVQRMMQLLRTGAIGPLRAVHIDNLWDYHGLRDQACRGNRRHRALENLGTLDCGVHHVDLARYMSGGEFDTVTAIGAIVEKANKFPDHIIIQARMNNGVLVSIQESAVWGYTAKERPAYSQSYRIVGEQGVLSAGLDFGSAEHRTQLYVVSGEQQWTETLDCGKAWDETYRQFFSIILGRPLDHRFIADGSDALINMEIAQQVIKQCQAGVRQAGAA